MISLTAPRFPRDARVPDADALYARGTIAMHRAHGVPLSMGGSSLEPDHETMAPPRASADAVTVAPCRGAR